MKKVFLTIVLFATSFIAHSQEKKEAVLTQAEQFSAQAGLLIEKQFLDVGKVNSVKLQIMSIKDLNSNTVKTALRFEYDYKSSYTSDTKVATLDKDELDALIVSMKNLQTNVYPTTRDNYTEVTFKSRTGFEAGSYFDIGKGWKSFLKLEKFDKNSMIFFNNEEFITLIPLLEQAKLKM